MPAIIQIDIHPGGPLSVRRPRFRIQAIDCRAGDTVPEGQLCELIERAQRWFRVSVQEQHDLTASGVGPKCFPAACTVGSGMAVDNDLWIVRLGLCDGTVRRSVISDDQFRIGDLVLQRDDGLDCLEQIFTFVVGRDNDAEFHKSP